MNRRRRLGLGLATHNDENQPDSADGPLITADQHQHALSELIESEKNEPLSLPTFTNLEPNAIIHFDTPLALNDLTPPQSVSRPELVRDFTPHDSNDYQVRAEQLSEIVILIYCVLCCVLMFEILFLVIGCTVCREKCSK